jgi:sortase A
MTLYRYVKVLPARSSSKKKMRSLSFVFMTIGGCLLLWALWPILSFTTFGDTLFSHIVSPVSEVKIISQSSSLSPVAFAAAPEITGNSDLTNANLWYPTSPQKHIVSKVNTYSLSIPKLKIANALVTIAGEDLVDSLVHYGGTGLPGQYGTAVVFGHSTLPQFYSPTNYKAIFSLLPTLKIGDEILVTYDGIQYRYTIYDMEVLEPTDLSVLEQQFDGSYLTLVTCVPPGTTWQRLNVKAKLSSL